MHTDRHTDRHKLAINNRTFQVEIPTNLTETASIAVKCWRHSRGTLEGGSDSREGVGLARRGGDTGICKPGIRGQCLLHEVKPWVRDILNKWEERTLKRLTTVLKKATAWSKSRWKLEESELKWGVNSHLCAPGTSTWKTWSLQRTGRIR